MRLHVVTALLCALSFLCANAQPTNPPKVDIMNFVPVSPEAAALGKFGDVPVSYYTGIPSIEIPLYTIELNSLKLPIGLSYHAGGVKVTEIASRVGLGFALNSSGMVARNIRGMQDDHQPWGYLNNGKVNDEASLLFPDYIKALRGYMDLEADEYVLNFPGGAGKFVLDKQLKALITPHQAIRIEPLGGANGQPYLGAIAGWRITSLDGTQYIFLEAERTSQDAGENGMMSNVTAWNLTKIISADQSETIEFAYELAGYESDMMHYATAKEFIRLVLGSCDSNMGDPQGTSGLVRTGFGVKQLKKITFPGGYVSFTNSSLNRCDVWGKFLEKIAVYTTDDVLVKEFTFKYGYLQGASITPVEQATCSSSGFTDRLVLLSVQETGKSPYRFDYIHDLGLPPRTSAAQDHWGFANRAHNDGLTLIPGIIKIAPTRAVMARGREVDLAYAKQGTLNEIVYPTGGATRFEYASNESVLTSSIAQGRFRDLYDMYDISTIGPIPYDVCINGTNVLFGTVNANNAFAGSTTLSFTVSNYNQSTANYVKLVNVSTGNEVIAEPPTVGGPIRSFSCTVPNGSYRMYSMRGEPGSAQCVGDTYRITLNSFINAGYKPLGSVLKVGGLRVSKITDIDPLTGAEKKRVFEYSPGILVWGIKYTSQRKEYMCAEVSRAEGGAQTSFTSYSVGEFSIFSATSNYPLSNTRGAAVGYGSVIMREQNVDFQGNVINNGYTEFQYSTANSGASDDFGFASYRIRGNPGSSLSDAPVGYSDGSYQADFQFPYAPPESNDWKRGNLLSTTVRKWNGDGTYRVVSKEVNNYSYITGTRRVRSIACGYLFDGSYNTVPRPMNAELDEVVYSYYHNREVYMRLDRKEIHSYDDDGHDFMKRENYYYDNDQHLLPTRVVENKSNGSTVTTVTSYPQDYSAGTASLDALIAANNLVSPIEKIVFEEDENGAVRVLGGTVFNYLDNGKGQKESVYSLENNASVPLSVFKFSNRALGVIPTSATVKTAYSIDSRYRFQVGFKYKWDRIVEQQLSDNFTHAYLWDATQVYPISHVMNANQGNIAFTSFEDGETGGWVATGGAVSGYYARTGARCFSMGENDALTCYIVNPDAYIVSYWSRNGSFRVNGEIAAPGEARGGWTYYQHRVSSPRSISVVGTGYIDELRLYPAKATMRTYVYQSLVGLSSQTDINDQTTFYYYDAAGRLEVVKDFNGKILQHYKYHYKGQ